MDQRQSFQDSEHIEMWVAIPNYQGLYEISTSGKVRSVKGKVPKSITIREPSRLWLYKSVTLCKGGIKRKHLVHRLVAQTFIPNPENKPTVNHKNGIKTDNRIENLEWSTRSEQNIHAAAMGLKVMKGENHSQNKLLTKQVQEIRTRYALGQSPVRIHKDFRLVSLRTIHDVITRKSWAHI